MSKCVTVEKVMKLDTNIKPTNQCRQLSQTENFHDLVFFGDFLAMLLTLMCMIVVMDYVTEKLLDEYLLFIVHSVVSPTVV